MKSSKFSAGGVVEQLLFLLCKKTDGKSNVFDPSCPAAVLGFVLGVGSRKKELEFDENP
jgi:hypothetical protein